MQLVVDDCSSGLGVVIDAELVHMHLGPLCIGELEPTAFLSMTFERSNVMHEIVGRALSSRLRTSLHAQQWSTGESAEWDGSVVDDLLQELVATRQDLARAKLAAASPASSFAREEIQVTAGTMILHTHSKRDSKRVMMIQTKAKLAASVAEFALRCRVAIKHVPNTLMESEQLMLSTRALFTGGDEKSSYDALTLVYTDQTCLSVIQELDLAIDSYTKDQVTQV